MKTIRTFNFFRAGVHTSMAGETLTFPRSDLEMAASAYSAELRLAPLVVNHPAADAPVLGQVKALSVNGDKVYATAEFSEGLVQDVRAKRFRGVSAKWFRPTDPRNPRPGAWYLRHIGFLDGVNPAVKGLDPVAFAEGAAECIEAMGVDVLEASFGGATEVMFAEAGQPAPQGDPMDNREAVDAVVRKVMEQRAGWTYAQALSFVVQSVIAYRERNAGSADKAQMNPDRVAFHEAAMSFRAAHPTVSYHGAVAHLFSIL